MSPGWNDILSEVKTTSYDYARRKYLNLLSKHTKRNTIIYYSGWLQKNCGSTALIHDGDMEGFMSSIRGLDRSKGLDIILHTPGGDASATEGIGDYLIKMFDKDIRAIIPQISMSGGTLLAFACKEICMGKHSCLGPIDPQFFGVAAHDVKEEFERALEECNANPNKRHIWQQIVAKYPMGFICQCEKAAKWSEEIAKMWLSNNMFSQDDKRKEEKIDNITNYFASHTETKTHGKHISKDICIEKGLTITDLEDDQKLQDLVLSVHHACCLTFSGTSAVKIIENHKGSAYINNHNIKY